jgi:hypothetical protein
MEEEDDNGARIGLLLVWHVWSDWRVQQVSTHDKPCTHKHTCTGENGPNAAGGSAGKGANRDDRWTDLGLDALQPE